MKQKSVYIEILSLVNGLIILFLVSHRIWFLYIAAGIGLLSVFIPSFATLLGTGLKKLIQLLGMFTNIIILAVVFIFVLTPIALLYRLFRKKKPSDNSSNHSFFIIRNHTYDQKEFERQW